MQSKIWRNARPTPRRYFPNKLSLHIQRFWGRQVGGAIMAVLQEVGVAIVPGDDFGFAAPSRHVRFSYATKYDRIEEAVSRMARLLGR